MTPPVDREQQFLESAGRQLLRQTGMAEPVEFTRLRRGRNNRVYLAQGRRTAVVLKWYFADSRDPRDRLHAEYSWLEFAERCGITSVARPLARSDADRLAVYSHLDGQPPRPADIGSDAVAQAVEFWRQLNFQRNSPAALALPLAAEACFSLRQHLDCVAGRMARLQGIAGEGAEIAAAHRFVQDTLMPLGAAVAAAVERWAAAAGCELDVELPVARRCLSPSDFGFHNALCDAAGKFHFFDFEYAGWDDPAKTICDFFCQPQVPAPRHTWQQFSAALLEGSNDQRQENGRYQALFPLYQLKWCTIVLNEFLPADALRRQFAEAAAIDLAGQLALARRMVSEIRL